LEGNLLIVITYKRIGKDKIKNSYVESAKKHQFFKHATPPHDCITTRYLQKPFKVRFSNAKERKTNYHAYQFTKKKKEAAVAAKKTLSIIILFKLQISSITTNNRPIKTQRLFKYYANTIMRSLSFCSKK
jgi:hypothetical protein